LSDRAERVCFELRVRADRLGEYRERHRAVWPEMLAALREAGWANYSLFLREDGMLIERRLSFDRLEEVFHLD
jgi:L-rhamnose mutarotase